jgi:predicted RNase H-like HicB family nuclease
MKTKENIFKERIDYVREGKYFVGHPVNLHGIIIRAKSLEELETRGKVLCKAMLDFYTKAMELPFELVEVYDSNIWLYGESEAKLREELQKYKDIFGELPN